MAGAGAGFGQSNVIGTMKSVDANSRANRQQEFNDRQIKVMEDEQANRQQQETTQQSGVADTEQQVEKLTAQVKSMENKASGEAGQFTMQQHMKNPSQQSLKDAISRIETNPGLMSKLKIQPGELTAAGMDNAKAIDQFIIESGGSLDNYSEEELVGVRQSIVDSGALAMYRNKAVDSFAFGEVSGSMKGAPEADVDNYEKSKTNIANIISGKPVESTTEAETDLVTSALNGDLAGTPDEDIVTAVDEVVKEPTPTPAVTLEAGEDGTKSGKSEIKNEAGDTVDVNVKVDKNGKSTLTASDGSRANVQKDGAGQIKEANGDVTTVGSDGQSVTVKADGSVQSNGYTLPPSVQMAYDMMGLKSSFSALTEKEKSAERVALAKAKKKSAGTPSNLEKMTHFYAGRINPVTKELNTPAESLRAAEDRLAKDKSARIKRLKDDYRIAESKNDTAGMKSAREGLLAENAGKSEVARDIEVRDITTAQGYSDKITVDDAIGYYNGSEGKAETAIAKSKARNLENRVDFSTKQEASMSDFKAKVQNQRKFGRAKAKVDKLQKEGKFKSGVVDSTTANLATLMPKSVVDATGLTDWFDSAIATKGTDRALVDYVKQISGLAVTDAEFQRLRGILGGTYTSEEARLEALNEFYEDLTNDLYAQGDSLYTDGYVHSVPKELALMAKASDRGQTTNPDNPKKVEQPKRQAVTRGEVTKYWDGKKYWETVDGDK